MNPRGDLQAALDRLDAAGTRTPCQDRQNADRWTSDDYADLDWAALQCVSARCPVLQVCTAAADARKEKHFTWGGTVRSPKPKRKVA